MTTWNPRANELFLKALELDSPALRQEYLDGACAGDAPLRAEVQALLAAHARAGDFLESPGPALNETVEMPSAAELAGTAIGPYKLIKQIGEGGFGMVFLAEQQEPIRRQVALKVLKPGMDSKQVLARFEAERQALALMDHPNIARVLDAGQTAAGRPYFVMEFVPGLPITEACDRGRLMPQQRLELFLHVCRAVQHAHQKGIIHRDLKPSNVLVAVHEAGPQVKVIDFGIAKALGGRLTEQTLCTGLAQMIGTPLYMSPEQAGVSNVDVDTRSDIYSLGALLYELLTGTTPFEKERLKRAAYEEFRRIVREEEPPRPSSRLSGTDALASISAQRHMEPAKLTKLVRGELDWIVMKALDKDRNRRYETASAFAQDVERYLHHEPVQACPPSPWYRFRKFARRNRGILTVVGLVAVVLGLATAISTREAVRANEAEGLAEERLDKEKQATQAALHARAESEARRLEVTREKTEKDQALVRVSQEKARADQNLARARKAVKDYLTKVADNRLLKEADFHELRRALLESAIPFYEEFVKQKSDDPELEAERGRAYGDLAELRDDLGEVDKACVGLEEKLAIFRRLVADLSAHPASDRGRLAMYRQDVAMSLRILGPIYHKSGQSAKAEAACREAVTLFLALKTEFPWHAAYRQEVALAGINLGLVRRELGRPKEGLADLSKAVELLEELVADFPNNLQFRHELAVGHNNLSVSFKALGKHDKALASLERAESLFKELSKESPIDSDYHEHWALALTNKSSLLGSLGRVEEGLAAQKQALDIQEKLAADFPSVPSYRDKEAMSHLNMSGALVLLSRPEEALKACDRAQQILDRLMQSSPKSAAYRQGLVQAHINRAAALVSLQRHQEALTSSRKACALQEQLTADFPKIVQHRQDLGHVYNNLADLLNQLDRCGEAITILEKALPIREALVRDFPEVPGYAVDLSCIYANMGNALRLQKQSKAALEWYAKALATLDPVLAQEPRLALARMIKSRTHTGRAATLVDLERYAEAVKDWDQALDFDDGFQGDAIRQERAAALARSKEGARPPQPQGGKVLTGTLTKDDPIDVFPMTERSHLKVHAVELEAGQPYLIDLKGTFDTFLRIEDSNRQPLLFNDDLRPDDLNSRLVFTPTRTDTYRLVVTSYRPGDTGAYTLTIRKAVAFRKPAVVENLLTAADRQNQGRLFKVYDMVLSGGSPWTIELESCAFETCLVLLDDAGRVVAHNDGVSPGTGHTSRLDFTPRVDATFTVVVTTVGAGETGAFRLTVQRYEAVQEKK
jgi:serine/threonine protein kinase/tetratricopeptide (TPR) repeat protein